MAGWAGGAGIKVSGSPLDEPEMPEQHVDTKHGLGITHHHTPPPQRLSSDGIMAKGCALMLDAFAISASLMHSLLVLPLSPLMHSLLVHPLSAFALSASMHSLLLDGRM